MLVFIDTCIIKFLKHYSDAVNHGFHVSENDLRSEFVREVEVVELVGEIASVLVESEGPDRVFVEADIMSNMDWFGLLGGFVGNKLVR